MISNTVDWLTLQMNNVTHQSILNRMLSEREKTEGILEKDKQFCFSNMLIEFGVELSDEQIEKMLLVLTQEQVECINKKLDIEHGWY